MSQLQIQAPSAAEAPAVDRRRGVRKQADLRIRVLLAEKGLGTAGHTVNISRHGALVRTFAPLRDNVTYDLFLEGPCGVEKVTARVVRELPDFTYALEFDAKSLVALGLPFEAA